MKIGFDVGSTTIKCIVLDEKDEIIFKTYERHFSQITMKTMDLLGRICEEFHDRIEGGETCYLAISGSAGMGRRRHVTSSSYRKFMRLRSQQSEMCREPTASSNWAVRVQRSFS